MDRGAWWATIHRVANDLATTDQTRQKKVGRKKRCVEAVKPFCVIPKLWIHVTTSLLKPTEFKTKVNPNANSGL